MTVSVSNDASFSSGAISFSALRLKFKKVSSGAVSLSELKRQTSLSLESPTVPDATENGNIPTVNSNIQLSDYRGSITYYRLTQTGTNTNFDIDAQSWNSNLGKNISKIFYVNGTLGATSTSNYAATFDAAAFNLSIIINGSIQGAGGAGGTPSSPNGKNGGPALYVRSNTSSGSTSTRKIKLYNTGNIYAGGGGGGCGAKGGTGGQGGSVVGLSGGAGGAGGNGGNGGRGQGYGQSRTNGSGGYGGSAGSNGATTTYYDFNRTPRVYSAGKGGTGGRGGTGGNGGTWGQSGTSGLFAYSGNTGGSTTSFMTYYANWSGTRRVTFGLYRDASFENFIYFGNSFPRGISGGFTDQFFRKFNNGSNTDQRDVPGGFYAPIYGLDNTNSTRGIKGILILNRTGNRYLVKGNTVSLDDSGRDSGFDYTDLEVTPNQGILYSSYSVGGSGGGGQLGNQGSGGSAGTRISGSNYNIVS